MSRCMAVVVVLVILSCVRMGVGIGYGTLRHKNHGGPKPPKHTPPAAEHWIDTPCVTRSKPKCPHGVDRPPLILVSLEGFHPDYIGRFLTPNIKRLSDCGTHSPYMLPSFPSLTDSNLYSIATGLYPEHHGLIGDSMYDPVMNESYYIGSPHVKNKDWFHGEPIWNTAMKNGLRTACYSWVGSDVDIQGLRPNYYFTYDDATTPEQRIDVVRGFLQLPTGKRPDFITLYFNELDHVSHDFGPFSDKVNTTLEEMDGYIADLMDAVVATNMHECVNIILLADHGVANRSCDLSIRLGDKNGINFPTGDYFSENTEGSMMRYSPKSTADLKEPKDVVDRLKCRDPNVVPYVKEDMPKRWHYMNSPRIEDVLIPVEQGYTITNTKASSTCDGGGHGYDDLAKQMQAVFMAYGPAFQKTLHTRHFQNIELFNIMCDVLGIPPPANDGEYGSLHHILKHPPSLPPIDESNYSLPLACPFPDTNQDYEDRLADDVSKCACHDDLAKLTDKTIKEFDAQLKLTELENDESVKKHAMFGVPKVTFKTKFCELNQADYITGYSHDLKMPIYTSFTIDRKASRETAPSLRCGRPDVRVGASDTPACTDYDIPVPEPRTTVEFDLTNLTMGFSYSPGLSETLDAKMDALITSNMVPRFRGFISEIESPYLDYYLPKWADKYNGINVVTGPIFDYDMDGLRDSIEVLKEKGQWVSGTVIPTHYFAVIIRCSENPEDTSQVSQPIGSDCHLIPLAFILRNKDGIQTCQSLSDYMETNTARVKDVELLTGLRFYPDMDRYEAIRLRIINVERKDFFKYWDGV